jgi:drug/metabolite transporter (DMT)-like permease
MHVSIERVILLFLLFAGILVAILGSALWAGRRWTKRHPATKGAKQVTPVGFALFGCETLLLFAGLTAPELQPHGPLGEFVSTPGGIIAYLVCVVVGCGLAGHALGKLGHPLMREKGHQMRASKH